MISLIPRRVSRSSKSEGWGALLVRIWSKEMLKEQIMGLALVGVAAAALTGALALAEQQQTDQTTAQQMMGLSANAAVRSLPVNG
jgi:hypothetical protein